MGISFDEMERKLEVDGIEQVRKNLSRGIYNSDKRPFVEDWLRGKDSAPLPVRRPPVAGTAGLYRPTAGDRRYCEADSAGDLNSFDEAVLLQGVSDAYLAVLAADNSGERSKALKAMVDAESARRGMLVARRANRIAISAVVVSLIAVVVGAVF